MFHVIMVKTGPRRNIKTVFPSYGDSHVKDKTVARPPPPPQVVRILWPAGPKCSPSCSKIWIPSDFGIAIMVTAKSESLMTLSSPLWQLLSCAGTLIKIRTLHCIIMDVYCGLAFLTYWGQDKMDAISQTPFQMHFLEWKCLNSD